MRASQVTLSVIVFCSFAFMAMAQKCDGTNMSCSLTGVCTDGTCVCAPPWSGVDCGTLDFLPVPAAQGYAPFPTTAWGGNVLRADDGPYHLFVAEMVNDCPLTNWGSNSVCRHATSATLQGPYNAAEVAVGVWCHNPHVVRLGDGSFALFHIGGGNGGSPKNCTSHGADKFSGDALVASSIHVASSLNGPWTPLAPNTLPSCNNPAPTVLKNGTILVVCDGSTIYGAPSVNGPWKKYSSIDTKGGPAGNYEDPFLWVDDMGRFHVIYHVYNTHEDRNSCVNSTVSAHSFSEDGITWRTGPRQPYTTQVQRTDGTTTTVSTRERPKLFFDPVTGQPTFLFTAVCSATACPQGPPTGCVDCKYANWDFNLAQGLRV